jgi:hypothetical protein
MTFVTFETGGVTSPGPIDDGYPAISKSKDRVGYPVDERWLRRSLDDEHAPALIPSIFVPDLFPNVKPNIANAGRSRAWKEPINSADCIDSPHDALESSPQPAAFAGIHVPDRLLRTPKAIGK